MRLSKGAAKLAIWAAILIVLIWLAFFHTDEFGMSSWEHTQDAFGRDDWIGWIHPFGTEVNKAVSIGPFDSLRQCQLYAFDRLERSYDDWQSAEYYCAYRCVSDDHRLRDESCKVVRK